MYASFDSVRGIADRSRADLAMDRYADGDDAAFEVVYEELERRLFGYLLRHAHATAAAEDALQQTFLQMLSGRATFARGAAVVPWAYAIARRVVAREAGGAHGRGGRGGARYHPG